MTLIYCNPQQWLGTIFWQLCKKYLVKKWTLCCCCCFVFYLLHIGFLFLQIGLISKECDYQPCVLCFSIMWSPGAHKIPRDLRMSALLNALRTRRTHTHTHSIAHGFWRCNKTAFKQSDQHEAHVSQPPPKNNHTHTLQSPFSAYSTDLFFSLICFTPAEISVQTVIN